MNIDAYRVTQDHLRLKDLDPRDRGSTDKAAAAQRTTELQERLSGLQERLYAEQQRSLLVILQARDAGGKDGTVKHVFSGVNPQGVSVVSFKAPTAEERAHDFLWRVHARTPGRGLITIFNRSQYEDVLVPMAHGTLDEEAARRRLKHIRAFEELLADEGTRILKFYLHISRDEQRERLQARLDEPDKRWKFNPADLEERARWDEYTRAYELCLSETSRKHAPWFVVPSDRKWFRNLVVSEAIVAALEDMNPRFPEATFDPAQVRVE
ncbi:polyphosphate kinase 2 family protein [Deinococcus pimensis]|uniref:polyphosphate kinase 2 family protein n=1 Tax=Deinococcus pimensis TaxID=309888 RepID=UPI0004847091|nr:polyphosphate kinase 2 family protein [Deinococcus pimensis]